MNKIIITGASGFVGRYLIEALNELGRPLEIVCITRTSHFDFTELYTRLHNLSIRTFHADLNDYSSIKTLLNEFRPDSVFHLASESSVSHSWSNPIGSFQNNTNIFLNLVESIRQHSIKCKVLSIGSSEEYGIVNLRDLPLQESSTLNPVSPYAVARVSQELLSKVYCHGYGMDIVMTRSFNHIGPGQRDAFVISSFAKQIAQCKHGKRNIIDVGDIDIVRDFLDVRDVVRAYISLMESGNSGETYNVCSGKGYSLREILFKMEVLADVNIDFQVKKELIRPSDNPVIIGDNKKIVNELNWQPLISIEQSLEDLLNYWEIKLIS